jgi:hypothetical protein
LLNKKRPVKAAPSCPAWCKSRFEQGVRKTGPWNGFCSGGETNVYGFRTICGGEPSLHGENQLLSPAQPFSVSKYRVKQIFKKGGKAVYVVFKYIYPEACVGIFK